jgi:hypothetical protein
MAFDERTSMKRRGFLGLLGAAAAAPFLPTVTPAPIAVGVDLAAGPDIGAMCLVTDEMLDDAVGLGHLFDGTTFRDSHRRFYNPALHAHAFDAANDEDQRDEDENDLDAADFDDEDDEFPDDDDEDRNDLDGV